MEPLGRPLRVVLQVSVAALVLCVAILAATLTGVELLSRHDEGQTLVEVRTEWDHRDIVAAIRESEGLLYAVLEWRRLYFLRAESFELAVAATDPKLASAFELPLVAASPAGLEVTMDREEDRIVYCLANSTVAFDLERWDWELPRKLQPAAETPRSPGIRH